VAEVERHTDLGAVELVGDPLRVVDAREPERGVWVERDADTVGLGDVGDCAELGEDIGVGLGG
jgi:hypothetical protein